MDLESFPFVLCLSARAYRPFFLRCKRLWIPTFAGMTAILLYAMHAVPANAASWKDLVTENEPQEKIDANDEKDVETPSAAAHEASEVNEAHEASGANEANSEGKQGGGIGVKELESPSFTPSAQAGKAAYAPGADAKKHAPAESREVVLRRIEDYLNAITTIVADFQQVAPDGSLSGGKFYLKRPGKMRWEYAPPTPILMVTSGSFLTFYDSQLEQVSNIPLDSTLAGFLARESIDFSDHSVTVDRVDTTPGAAQITLHQTQRPKDGKLVLEFSTAPMQLRNMVITDPQGQVTNVSLSNARFGEALLDDLFIFRDPRKKTGSARP